MATGNDDSRIMLSILQYLKTKLNSDCLSDDKKESLEVSVMCLQEVFGVDPDNPDHQSQFGSSLSLEELFARSTRESGSTESGVTAEDLKNKGNVFMKEGKFDEAVDMYTQALKLDSSNATYYANRAAAFMKINCNDKALLDCQEAVRLNPSYAKVYMRMGVIYQKLNNNDKAKECYKKAVDLEPDNAEYKSNLQSLEQPPSGGVGGAGSGPRFDGSAIGNLMNNPMFMNLASTVMSNPAFQNVASGLLQSQMSGGGTGSGSAPNIAEMMPQFAQMAQQMQESNPEMFESMRSQAAQFRPNHDDKLPPE